MHKSLLTIKHFQDEEAAYRYVEERLWPNGPVCPHCGSKEKVGKLNGKSTRIGTYKCYVCRKPFTVKVGTIFESSHIPLNVWLQAMYLVCASKKGFSSNQLHRTLGVTLKTAWFMSHRIREAMREGELFPFGLTGGPVESDETFLWDDPELRELKPKSHAGFAHKNKVLSLVDRQSGNARSMVVDNLSIKTIMPILQENICQ